MLTFIEEIKSSKLCLKRQSALRHAQKPEQLELNALQHTWLQIPLIKLSVPKKKRILELLIAG